MTFVDFFKKTELDQEPFFQTLAHVLDMPDVIFEQMKLDLYDTLLQDMTGSEFMKELAENSDLSIREMQEEFLVAEETYQELLDTEGKELPQDRKDFFMEVIRMMRDQVLAIPIRKQLEVVIEKTDEEVILPTYAHETDAGADVYANETVEIMGNTTVLVGTGLKVAIPEGWEIQLRPRSGMSLKTPIRIANCVGTIDSGFRDEIKVPCWNTSPYPFTIKKGDRIAQMILAQSPMIKWAEGKVDEIDGDRKGGFGSTGE